MLAIISNLEDLTADYFICHLEKRGRPYVRLNAELASRWAISCRFDDAETASSLDIGHHRTEFRDIQAVWYRRLFLPSAPAMPDAQFAVGEIRHAIDGLLRATPAFWVNDPESTARAELKLFQLNVAKQCGANVPRTLISNDPAVILDFVSAVPKVISKPMHAGLFREGQDQFAVYTERVSLRDVETYRDELTNCPTMFQEELVRDVDYRITVIGDKIFAAAIYRRADCVDWRHPEANARFSSENVPEAVESTCRKIMRALNLQYGAFDFIKTKDGQWYFLEVNPVGEWAWLEEELGLPMRTSLENLLYSHH